MSTVAVVVLFWGAWFLAASPDGGRYLPSADQPAGALVIVALVLAHVLAGVLIGRWRFLPLLAIAPVATAVPFSNEWPLMVVWVAPVWLLVAVGMGIRLYIDGLRES